MLDIYEKLGLFYLGHDLDNKTQAPTDVLTVLKNKNFTTHAAIIGMTGSGKTGLGIGLIEEAAIDNIPAIIIDPKGDMGNLCLTDPSFSAETFAPWVADEAQAKATDLTEYATKIAQRWKSGIEKHHQDSARVEKFSRVKKTIYTPGSSAGIGINILSSLDAPPTEIRNDTDSFAAYLKTTVSSLLALVGIEADPLESKEYLLLAQIISHSWITETSLGLADLIGRIINPSFKKIGVLPLESFYPQATRFKLASKFNAIIASPTFSAWLQGEPLNIQNLLYDDNGKAKISIFSIAHLGDDERMFFVTLLLNQYIAWMRRQSGTASLKAVLYMDEIAGFFPPTKNPPSKEPMLLLLKQARAFGSGVILSTQNPVDLDYKGLSNIGTWFIGRLQTTQDIDRVIDGLEGKVGSSFNKKEIRTLLANLKKRTFFLKSAHLDDIRIFATRWVLSYLKGPLKREEISRLMAQQKSLLKEQTTPSTQIDGPDHSASDFENFPGLDNNISQHFMPDLSETHQYTPSIMAQSTLHFFNQTRGIDIREHLCLTLEVDADIRHLDWNQSHDANKDLHNHATSRLPHITHNSQSACFSQLPTQAPAKAKYASLPDCIKVDKKLRASIKSLKDWLYHKHRLELFRCKSPKLESHPYEPLADFKVRLNDLLNDKKEIAITKLQERYSRKEQVLLTRLARAKQRVEKEQSDTKGSMLHAGVAVLGALFGRSSSAKVGRAISKGNRVLKERADVSRAQQRVNEVKQDIEELEYELEGKVDALADKFDSDQVTIEDFAIKLRRTDIVVENLSVVWKPLRTQE